MNENTKLQMNKMPILIEKNMKNVNHKHKTTLASIQYLLYVPNARQSWLTTMDHFDADDNLNFTAAAITHSHSSAHFLSE